MAPMGYQYAIDLFKEDGTFLGRVLVRPDWDPAVECIRFTGIREGRLPPTLSSRSSEIRPIWDMRKGEPFVAGFQVTVLGNDGEAVSGDIPPSYFHGLSRQISAHFVEKGKLNAGEFFRYGVLAFPSETKPIQEPAAAARFTVEEVPQALSLVTLPLADLMDFSKPFGNVNTGDMPVFIPQSVLGEAADLTRQAGAKETGGILIGHLCRDVGSPEIAARITAQIPARHTRSELTRLTFTADTWAAAQTAINLRRKGELYLGWWHSHSYMKEKCQNCERRVEGTCADSIAFMSEEDCALHRTVFPRAYSIALVISDSPCSGLTWELFGWRSGMIAPRGFFILGVPKPDAHVEAMAPTDGGLANATSTR